MLQIKNLTKRKPRKSHRNEKFLEAKAKILLKISRRRKTTEQLTENLVIPKFEHRKAMNKDFTKTFVEGIVNLK